MGKVRDNAIMNMVQYNMLPAENACEGGSMYLTCLLLNCKLEILMSGSA